MKKLILNLVFLGAFIGFAQTQNRVFYYDEQGEKIYLEKDNNVEI